MVRTLVEKIWYWKRVLFFTDETLNNGLKSLVSLGILFWVLLKLPADSNIAVWVQQLLGLINIFSAEPVGLVFKYIIKWLALKKDFMQ